MKQWAAVGERYIAYLVLTVALLVVGCGRIGYDPAGELLTLSGAGAGDPAAEPPPLVNDPAQPPFLEENNTESEDAHRSSVVDAGAISVGSGVPGALDAGEAPGAADAMVPTPQVTALPDGGTLPDAAVVVDGAVVAVPADASAFAFDACSCATFDGSE